jgi:ABC-type branched-subunit amino acid transport system ATPase component
VSGRVRSGLAYVPQEYNVFRNMTVLENLKIAHEFMTPVGGGHREVVANEVLELFPELPSKFSVRAGNLSGGQRQMLAFACALAIRPALLVLDEPSAGLSPRYMSDIFQSVRKVNAKGVAVLMVEQNAVEALAISDTCVVMANGQVRMTASAEDVLKMDDLRSLYLGNASERPA